MKNKNHRTTIRSRSFQRFAKMLRSRRRFLSAQYHVKEIGIFGSSVRDDRDRHSDVDILVDFNEVPDLLKFIELELYLEKILKKKVDLVDKQGLRPEFRQDILNEVVYV